MCTITEGCIDNGPGSDKGQACGANECTIAPDYVDWFE